MLSKLKSILLTPIAYIFIFAIVIVSVVYLQGQTRIQIMGSDHVYSFTPAVLLGGSLLILLLLRWTLIFLLWILLGLPKKIGHSLHALAIRNQPKHLEQGLENLIQDKGESAVKQMQKYSQASVGIFSFLILATHNQILRRKNKSALALYGMAKVVANPQQAQSLVLLTLRIRLLSLSNPEKALIVVLEALTERAEKKPLIVELEEVLEACQYSEVALETVRCLLDEQTIQRNLARHPVYRRLQAILHLQRDGIDEASLKSLEDDIKLHPSFVALYLSTQAPNKAYQLVLRALQRKWSDKLWQKALTLEPTHSSEIIDLGAQLFGQYPNNPALLGFHRGLSADQAKAIERPPEPTA